MFPSSPSKFPRRFYHVTWLFHIPHDLKISKNGPILCRRASNFGNLVSQIWSINSYQSRSSSAVLFCKLLSLLAICLSSFFLFFFFFRHVAEKCRRIWIFLYGQDHQVNVDAGIHEDAEDINFVRHGQSTFNERQRYRPWHSSLRLCIHL